MTGPRRAVPSTTAVPPIRGRESARLVASWSTTEADVDGLLAALKP